MRVGKTVIMVVAFIFVSILAHLASINPLAVATGEMTNEAYGLSMRWKVISNPSPSEDHASSVCYLNGAIYSVGYSSTTEGVEIRVEKRSGATGDLLAFKTFSYNGNPVATDCVAFHGVIYLTGYFTVEQTNQIIDKSIILILDENLEQLKAVEFNNTGVMAIENDESSLYLVGVIREGDSPSFNWVILKLSPDGEILGNNTFQIGGLSLPTSLRYDPLYQQIWVIGGREKRPGIIEWTVLRVSPSNLTSIENIDIDYPFYPSVVAIDQNGFAYVTGSGGTVKISPEGEVLIRIDGLEGRKMVILSGSFLLMGITTYELNTQSLLKLLTLDLEEVASLYLGENIELDNGKMAIDGSNIYFAGDYVAQTDVSWVIYSVAVVKPEITTSPTETTTITQTSPVFTTTVTTTVTETTTVTTTETTTVTETVTSYTPVISTTTETLRETIVSTVRDTITLTKTHITTTTVVSNITSTVTVTEKKTITTTETSVSKVTVEKTPELFPITIAVLTLATIVASTSSLYLYSVVKKLKKQ